MDRVNRLIAIVSLPLLIAVAGPAQGLGLGEARVNSFLNQPLDFTIRLIDVSDEELETLTVGPAQRVDYERMGVISDALALGLTAELDRSISPPSVRIRSERSANDPVLQVLVDARWANGRMLREYTLFLDPPTVDVAPPVTRVEPAARPAQPESRPAQPAPRREPPAARPAREIGETYGPVASGETLWAIARDWRPDPSLTMNQVMLAIAERNPHAFRDGNVNHLLRGERLEMPTLEEVAGIDAREATARVQAQSEAFRARRRPEETPVVADAAIATEEPRTREDAGAPVSEIEHRLELVPPRDDDVAGGAGEAGELSRLQEDLARMEEELFAARMEAQELRSRLAEIEAFLTTEWERMGLPDAELARFQQSLREARLARLEAAESGLDPEAAGEVQSLLAQLRGEIAAADSAGADPDPQEAEPAAAEPEAAAEPPPPATEAPRATEIGQQRSGIGGLLTQPLVLGLIALLVLLVVVLLAWQMLRNRWESGPPATASARRSRPDALDRARERVRKNPEELGGHLALLKILASKDDPEAFGGALEEMFGYVNTGQERSWRDALVLASSQVPEHPLVAGSEDAIQPGAGAGSRDASAGTLSEADDRTREILRILEEERLESGPDVGDEKEQSQPEYTGGPELGAPLEPGDEPGAEPGPDVERRAAEAAEGSDQRGLDKAWGSGEETEEPPMDLDFDMSDLPDPDRADEARESDDRIEEFLRSQGMEEEPGPVDEGSAPEPPGGESELPEGTGPEDPAGGDDVTLDWGSDAIAADEELPEGTGEDSEIFSLGEDDVEVKLDLARAYISMEDPDAARTMLEEVLKEGTSEQQEHARKLLDGL